MRASCTLAGSPDGFAPAGISFFTLTIELNKRWAPTTLRAEAHCCGGLGDTL